MFGDDAVVQMLLEAGASTDIRDNVRGSCGVCIWVVQGLRSNIALVGKGASGSDGGWGVRSGSGRECLGVRFFARRREVVNADQKRVLRRRTDTLRSTVLLPRTTS